MHREELPPAVAALGDAGGAGGFFCGCGQAVVDGNGWGRVDGAGLVAAAAAATAATAAGQRGQVHGAEVAAGTVAGGDGGEYGDGAFGGLCAAGAVGAGGGHRLEFVEAVVAGEAAVFVDGHFGEPLFFCVGGGGIIYQILMKGADSYQFFKRWSAMGIALSAPVGLLAAKNSSNIGEFREFLRVLRFDATLLNTDSRRSR